MNKTKQIDEFEDIYLNLDKHREISLDSDLDKKYDRVTYFGYLTLFRGEERDLKKKMGKKALVKAIFDIHKEVRESFRKQIISVDNDFDDHPYLDFKYTINNEHYQLYNEHYAHSLRLKNTVLSKLSVCAYLLTKHEMRLRLEIVYLLKGDNLIDYYRSLIRILVN